MLPDDRIRLQHIVDEAEEACRFVVKMRFDEFVDDRKTVKAVIRSIEVIGEAAAKLTPGFTQSYPDIPWAQIVGMRNHLIHVYFDIDYSTIWRTVLQDLPGLIARIRKLLDSSV